MNNNKMKHGSKLFILPSIALLAGAGYLTYNILLLEGIENIIRMSIIGGALLIALILLLISLKIIMKGKLLGLIILSIICLLFSGVFFTGAILINKAYSSISKINKTEYTYTTSLVVMSDSGINSINDLSSKKIGIINDEKSIDGYIISQEIIKANNINSDVLVKYDSYLEMLTALYNGDINGVFISSTYISTFSPVEKFANIASETKTIVSKSKKVTKKVDNTNSQITKPFTILVLGIDATEDDISKTTSFLSDTIILITFNPKTQNSTILSIPRDTYVPIMCSKNNTKAKINSAGTCGEAGVEKTIENLTGINIDYYVKINFKGVINLVDAVGGITVDIPYDFCEQNSDRLFGKYAISLTKGIQTLNGEQALAFSRNRHSNPSKLCKSDWKGYVTPLDFGRGQNQQTVIKALLDKIKGTTSITVIYDLLDLLQKNMDTNISTSQILSLYNIAKSMLTSGSSAEDILSFQKLYLQTHSLTISGVGDAEIYYPASLDLIVNTMKTNLDIIEPTDNKTFSFSVNEIYEEQIIGKDVTNITASNNKVPNFTANYTKLTASYWGDKNDVKITYNTVESSNALYTDGQIIKQSITASTLVSSVKSSGITLTIVKKTAVIASNTSNSTRTDCTKLSNKENSNCIIPNFVTENYKATDVLNWTSKITDDSVTIVTSSITVKTTNKLKDGYVASQDATAYKSLYNLSSKMITIKYYKY